MTTGTCSVALQTLNTNGILPLACNSLSTCLSSNNDGSAVCDCRIPTTNGSAYCSGNPGDAVY